jgi:luciferase-like monooxygenase
MALHHFQPEGTELIPNVLMMAMHLCGVTRNIRIGCGFNIVPMWHPLRLAEDYAMADILTGGRPVRRRVLHASCRRQYLPIFYAAPAHARDAQRKAKDAANPSVVRAM